MRTSAVSSPHIHGSPSTWLHTCREEGKHVSIHQAQYSVSPSTFNHSSFSMTWANLRGRFQDIYLIFLVNSQGPAQGLASKWLFLFNCFCCSWPDFYSYLKKEKKRCCTASSTKHTHIPALTLRIFGSYSPSTAISWQESCVSPWQPSGNSDWSENKLENY